MEMEMEMEMEVPIMIAMKGHPGTGKSTIAHYLATALRCPLVDKDDVRDCTSTLEHTIQQLSSSSPDATTACNLLNQLSYEVTAHIASTQLRLGLPFVVLDSPLSLRAHLDRLIQLAASSGARVVIVECKANDEAEWRRRLERRGSADGASWHKPSTWQDLKRLIEGYGGCTDYDTSDVPKLVVDTTASVGVGVLVSSVLDFIASCGGRGPRVDYSLHMSEETRSTYL